MLVTAIATEARPVVYAGHGPMLLQNRDLATTVYLGPDSGMTPTSSDVEILDPLGSLGLDGLSDRWVMTASGTAVVQSSPGGTAWGPSPLLIAEQIAASGVPLLRSTTLLAQGTNVALPGSGAVTLPASGFFTLTQIAFYLYIAIQAGAGATVPFTSVELQWTDTASGVAMPEDQAYIAQGSTKLVTAAYGPVAASALKVVLTNLDTHAATFDYVLLATSSVYGQVPQVLFASSGGVAVPGFTGPNVQPQAGLLSSSALAVGAGATVTRLIPLYSGEVDSSITQQGVSSGNFTFQMVPAASLGQFSTAVPLLSNNTLTGGGIETDRIKLPRIPMLCSYKNSGAVNANVTHAIQSVASN